MEEYFRQIAARTGEGERVASAVVVSSRGSTPQDIGAHVDVVFFLIDRASPSYVPRRPGEPTLATVAI